jgi:hypothetical protein
MFSLESTIGSGTRAADVHLADAKVDDDARHDQSDKDPMVRVAHVLLAPIADEGPVVRVAHVLLGSQSEVSDDKGCWVSSKS